MRRKAPSVKSSFTRRVYVTGYIHKKEGMNSLTDVITLLQTPNENFRERGGYKAANHFGRAVKIIAPARYDTCCCVTRHTRDESEKQTPDVHTHLRMQAYVCRPSVLRPVTHRLPSQILLRRALFCRAYTQSHTCEVCLHE